MKAVSMFARLGVFTFVLVLLREVMEQTKREKKAAKAAKAAKEAEA